MRAPGKPTRTCVGCRVRAGKSDLLRVAAVESESGLVKAWRVAPDPRGRLPGRGAYVHRDLGCLDLAEHRRAFPRALRLSGPLDLLALRRWLEEQAKGNNKGDTT